MSVAAAGVPVLDLHLNAKQSLAIQSPAAETLYGGAAGGGKSYLIRAAAIMWCLEVPGLQCYLFRRTWPEIELNHLQGSGNFHQMLAPLIESGHAKVVGKEVRFYNGSRINLRHLQNYKDLTIYQGAEIHVLLLDEATHFTDEEYRYLRGRMRLGTLQIPAHVKTSFPRAILGTNPGGVGHHWAKQGFVDHGEFVVHKSAKEDGGMLRTFVPAKLHDNPAMTENDPDYEDRLEGLGDPELIRALRDGDWEVVAGSMYGSSWRRKRHVISPFDIPVDWDIWAGMDDGFAAQASCMWLTQDPKIKTYYCIEELYRKKMFPTDFVERVKAKHQRIGRADGEGDPMINRDPFKGLMDSGAFANNGQAETPRGTQMKKLGLDIRPVEKWPGSRVHRTQNLHRLLAPNPLDPLGRPGIQFFDCCENIIRTLPALGRDKRDPEKVDTDHEDHAYDGLTYGLQWKTTKAGTFKVTGT